MTHRSVALVVSAVLAAAVLAGILTVGGPGTGRKERFDQSRHDEILRLAQAVSCSNGRFAAEALPDALTVAALREHCDGIFVRETDLTDDETGAPYTYRRLSGTKFEICAEFFDARTIPVGYETPTDLVDFDSETGCFVGRLE